MNTLGQILVTGSDGFIGKHLVRFLRKRQFVVEEFDQAHGDISDYRFSFSGLSHVFHLASRTYVPASWDRPFDFYRTNVLGTVNILELCRKQACSLTYVSSNIYGTPQYLPVDEKHPIRPASPYSHSKLVAEEICGYYAEVFQVPVTVLRPVNIYGVGQSGEFLIPTIIRQVRDPNTTSVTVRDTRPKCDYLYIDDFLDALFCTINTSGFEIYNIGSGYSVSVDDIISTVLHCANVDKAVNSEHSERKNEVWNVYTDVSKFQTRFSWTPKVSLKDGLLRCIEA